MSKQPTPVPEKVYLDGAAILALRDEVIEEVEVPEWGTWVRVRAITAAERDRVLASCVSGKGKHQKFDGRLLRLRVVALAAVDRVGCRLFTNAQVVDLGHKNAAAVDRVAYVAFRLGGLEDDVTEEAVEDFADAQSDASPSA